MKEKLLGLLQNKTIVKTVIAVLVVIVLIIILANTVFSAKPKKYEEKVKDLAKALSSESKMKSMINDKIIDPRGAAAWLEADQDDDDFKKEYKNIKKDDDEVEDMKKGLKAYAELNEKNKVTYKIKGVKKPEKSDGNGKIYTVKATLVYETESLYGSSENEAKVKIVFYKGKIIDIINTNTKLSYFEVAAKTDSDDE